MRSFDLVVEDHPRYTFHLTGPFRPSGRLRVRDTNYVSSEGTSRLAIRGRAGVVVTGDSLPGDVAQIEIRPMWSLSDEEERRTKQVHVEYRSPVLGAGAGAERSSCPMATSADDPPPAARSRACRGQAAAIRASGWDIERVVALCSVAIAIALGAAHAIQPGHGKTLVTAVALGLASGSISRRCWVWRRLWRTWAACC